MAGGVVSAITSFIKSFNSISSQASALNACYTALNNGSPIIPGNAASEAQACTAVQDCLGAAGLILSAPQQSQLHVDARRKVSHK